MRSQAKRGLPQSCPSGEKPSGGQPATSVGMAVPVQLEFLRRAPDVGGVRGGIDGQVPDEGDPVGVGKGAQGVPLAEEEVLGGPVDSQLRRKLCPGGVQCGGTAEPDGILPVPPGGALPLGLQGGEEGVVLQPEGVLPAEGGIVLRRGGEQPLRGPAQDSPALAVEVGRSPPGGGPPPRGGTGSPPPSGDRPFAGGPGR